MFTSNCSCILRSSPACTCRKGTTPATKEDLGKFVRRALGQGCVPGEGRALPGTFRPRLGRFWAREELEISPEAPCLGSPQPVSASLVSQVQFRNFHGPKYILPSWSSVHWIPFVDRETIQKIITVGHLGGSVKRLALVQVMIPRSWD